jgi:hypothetical protein
MDFNYGTSSNVQTHKSYTSTQLATGVPYTNGQPVNIEINDLPIGNYYFSTTARNDVAGRESASSAVLNWGASLQNNSVTFNQIANTVSGVSVVLAQASFTIPTISTLTVTMPINLTGGTYNVPVYLDGTTVSPSEYFPYYQGTSLQADGYAIDSSSPFNPADASLLAMTNGQNNWWTYMFMPTTITSGFNIANSLETSFVADNDTIIQICPYFTSTIYPGLLIGYTYLMGSYELKQNLPLSIVKNTTFLNALASNTGFGYLIRNMVSGTRVTAVAGSLTIKRTK